MAMKHGLGRGLSALLRDEPARPENADMAARLVPLDRIRRNPLQPRRRPSRAGMDELIVSVRASGVIQPLIVRPAGEGYELIAGERRYLAAQAAGLTEVPVVVRDAGDREALEMALVENLQREDLNALEEAEGYRLLSERFELTQERIAERVGKARATVANVLRVLDLPEEVRDLVGSGALSAGHAKALLGAEKDTDRILLARETVRSQLSVRNLEKLVDRSKRPPRKPRVSRDDVPGEHVEHITDGLRRHLGTSVRVRSCRTYANGKKAKGRIEIDFHSNEELDGLLRRLGLSETGEW